MSPSVVSRRNPVRFRLLAALVQPLTMGPCFLSICQRRLAHNRLFFLGSADSIPNSFLNLTRNKISLWEGRGVNASLRPSNDMPVHGYRIHSWMAGSGVSLAIIGIVHFQLALSPWVWILSLSTVLYNFMGQDKCVFPRTSRKIAKYTKSSVIKERCNLFFSTY